MLIVLDFMRVTETYLLAIYASILKLIYGSISNEVIYLTKLKKILMVSTSFLQIVPLVINS